MIELVSLRMKNFLSHVDSTLDFTKREGLILIEGKNSAGFYSSNGAGKSTVLEGIVYALTGNTLRGLGVNDVINRNYKKNTQVTLTFLSGGVRYSVSRYRKDDAFGDSLVVYREEENISKRLNKDTQVMLDSILGISYKVLISTMLLGEGLSSRFTQLSDPEKKSLIESTLNLNYDMSALRSKANSNVISLKSTRSNLEGRLSAIQDISSLDREDILKRLGEYKSSRESAIQEKGYKEARKLQIDSELETIQSKLLLLNSSVSELQRIRYDIDLTYREIAKESLELSNLLNAEAPHCPTCNQTLSSQASKNSTEESYRRKINELSDTVHTLEGKLKNYPDESILTTKIESLSAVRNSLLEEVRVVDSELVRLSGIIVSSETNMSILSYDLQKCDSLSEDVSSIEDELSKVSVDISKYEYFYDLFSPTGIIVNILSDAIDYINSRLSTYSDVLLEKKYSISFKKGKISLVDSSGSSYQSLSNGEKKRLDISIQFSLHDYVHSYCGLKVNTLFIDEVMDALDDVGVNNIIEVLRMKLEYCHLNSVYVITHNDSLKSMFDSFVTVEKDMNGNSKLA